MEVISPQAAVPLRVTIAAPNMLRLTIGDRPSGAASSYLSPPPLAAATAAVARLDAGAIVATHDGGSILFSTATGRLVLRLDLASIALTPSVRLRFEFLGEQHFYGLGEGGAQFDRLGGARRLWNFQSNRGHGADIAIPLLVSQAGYALCFDNSAAGRIVAETEIVCNDDAAAFVCVIAAPTGDASVIPPGRRYTLRIRTDRTPGGVTRGGVAHPDWRRDGAFLVIADLVQPASVRITW
jgi:hypothetical protein